MSLPSGDEIYLPFDQASPKAETKAVRAQDYTRNTPNAVELRSTA
jgi:hypothetical protein